MTIKTINDLKPDPNNANRGTERGHRIVNNSIQRHGAGRSGLAARDGTMIAGSQTLEEMAALGMKIKPVHTTGDEWVVVIRDDVEPGSEQATLMGLEDNRGAQEGIEWDPGILAELAQQFDVSGLFTGDELAEWAQPSEPEAGAGGDEFDTTPDDGPTRAQLGDLWIIGGKHRLMVGDCTDPAVVERLMGGERADILWTDPPYNVAYEGKTEDALTIDNDNMSPDDFRIFLGEAFLSANTVMNEGAVYYIAHPDVFAYEFIGATRDAGWRAARPAVVQWVKDSMVLGRGDYHSRSEPILYGWKPGAAHHMVTDRTQDNVWEIPRPKASEDHPTMKPVELVERALRNSSNRGDLAIDWFLGSGTTLIAAHRTGRRCYGCEISPKYADVILRRAEAEGLTTELVPSS